MWFVNSFVSVKNMLQCCCEQFVSVKSMLQRWREQLCKCEEYVTMLV